MEELGTGGQARHVEPSRTQAFDRKNTPVTVSVSYQPLIQQMCCVQQTFNITNT